MRAALMLLRAAPLLRHTYAMTRRDDAAPLMFSPPSAASAGDAESAMPVLPLVAAAPMSAERRHYCDDEPPSAYAA